MARPAGSRQARPRRDEIDLYLRLLRNHALAGNPIAAATLLMYDALTPQRAGADHAQEGNHGR